MARRPKVAVRYVEEEEQPAEIPLKTVFSITFSSCMADTEENKDIKKLWRDFIGYVFDIDPTIPEDEPNPRILRFLRPDFNSKYKEPFELLSANVEISEETGEEMARFHHHIKLDLTHYGQCLFLLGKREEDPPNTLHKWCYSVWKAYSGREDNEFFIDVRRYRDLNTTLARYIRKKAEDDKVKRIAKVRKMKEIE